jgi:hypothetical protein
MRRFFNYKAQRRGREEADQNRQQIIIWEHRLYVNVQNLLNKRWSEVDRKVRIHTEGMSSKLQRWVLAATVVQEIIPTQCPFQIRFATAVQTIKRRNDDAAFPGYLLRFLCGFGYIMLFLLLVRCYQTSQIEKYCSDGFGILIKNCLFYMYCQTSKLNRPIRPKRIFPKKWLRGLSFRIMMNDIGNYCNRSRTSFWDPGGGWLELRAPYLGFPFLYSTNG